MGRWAPSFALADEVILLPVYAASEEPIDGVTSERLLQELQAAGKSQVQMTSPEQILEDLTTSARPGDLILFLGAGSVGSLASRLVEALRGKREAICR